MTKAKSTHTNRTKRAPRDMSAERRSEVDAELSSSGVIDDELDERRVKMSFRLASFVE